MIEILLLLGLANALRGEVSAFFSPPTTGVQRRILPRPQSSWGGVPYRSASYQVNFSMVDNDADSSLENKTKSYGMASDAVKKAEELRQRAQKLMAEARDEEAALRESRSKTRKERISEGDAMIAHLFGEKRPSDNETTSLVFADGVQASSNHTSNATVALVADRIRQERWSKEQLIMVVERLHERQTFAQGGRRFAPEKGGFQIGSEQNAAVVSSNETEYAHVDGYLQSLIIAASTLDEEYEDALRSNKNEVKHEEEKLDKNMRWPGRVSPALKTRLKELRRADEEGFKRRLAAELNAAMRKDGSESSTRDAMMGYVRRTLGQPEEPTPEKNVTRILEQVAAIPMWVPSSILPFVVVARTRLDPYDIKTIQSDVLRGTEFYCTGCESISAAAVFRGNVRTAASGIINSTTDQNQTAVVFEKIQNRLEETGLSERVQVFFLKDPEWRPRRDIREPEPRPVILAVPKAVVPEQKQERGTLAKIVAGISVLMTLFTTFGYAVAAYALNPDFFERVINQNDYSALTGCVPLCLGVVSLQVVHEVAHYYVARRAQIKLGLPIPLPSLQLGLFGAITPLRSFPSSRAALLDLALSGPIAQMTLSLICMICGIFATVFASTDSISHFPVIPVALLKSSFLTGTMLTALAPKTLMLPLSQPIPIHPLFVAGFSGLISAALNLLPAGRLDGGRACAACLGSRFNVLMTFLTMLLLAILSLTGSSTISIFFGALIVLLQRNQEVPVRNEVTDVDNVRFGAYAMSMALAFLALAPFPGGGFI